MKFDKELFVQAGMTPTDQMQVLGVSRPTIYKWARGGNIHPYLCNQVADVTDKVRAALEAGRLPLAPSARTRRGNPRFAALATALQARG